MPRIKHCLAAAFVVLSVNFAPSAQAQDVERQKAIIELLQVTGMSNVLGQMITGMSSNVASAIKQQKPDMPDKVVTILTEEILAGLNDNQGSLIANIAVLYEKYFTAAEIRELIAFYKTPIGRKALSTLPQITSESMQIGQQWAQSVMPQIIERAKARLAEEGYQL